jgi:hypothetical protein
MRELQRCVGRLDNETLVAVPQSKGSTEKPKKDNRSSQTTETQENKNPEPTAE